MATQNYIGTQNGVVVCVDAAASELEGRFYHSYSTDAQHFRDEFEALAKM